MWYNCKSRSSRKISHKLEIYPNKMISPVSCVMKSQLILYRKIKIETRLHFGREKHFSLKSLMADEKHDAKFRRANQNQLS